MPKPRPVDRSTASFGLTGWRGRPGPMSVAHSHNDVELNYIEHGELTYAFGGEQLTLAAGDLCLFWAARPHQLAVGPAAPTLHWFTLPLARFLSWRLPEPIVRPVLAGAPLLYRHRAAGRPYLRSLEGWCADLGRGGAERQQIVCLELEALLRRLALELGADAVGATPLPEGRRGHAAQMARFMAANFTQPLTVAAIAASAGVHPHYAMQLFREAYGLSIVAYLTQYRVAHAQQLLLTTDVGALEIGLSAGFASASRFYSAFKAACGVSPGAYRAALRA